MLIYSATFLATTNAENKKKENKENISERLIFLNMSFIT